MAILINRSPWLITVPRRPELEREFPFKQKASAETYLQSLRAEGLKSKLAQLGNAFQVRARDAGFASFCASFDCYEEAEKTLKQIEAERSLSIFRDYSAATKVTAGQLMERYIDAVSPGHKGADIEIGRLKRLIRYQEFVDKPLAVLVTEDLQDFITERLSEVAPSTVDRELDLIRQVLNYAANVWKIAPVEDPFKGLQRPKYFNERDRRLRPDEEVRLLDAARAHGNAFIEPVIIIALATAMRRGEILSLRWEHIDFASRSALLPVTKNGRARKVPLSAQAIAVLMSLPREHERVFPISANALKKAFFGSVLKRARIDNFHFHDLRHEAISRFAESGLFPNVVDLQAVTGHRDVRMLLRYAHLCPRQLAEKMDEIENRRGITNEYVHRGRRRQVVTPIELTPAAKPSPLRHTAQLTSQGNSICAEIPRQETAVKTLPATLDALRALLQELPPEALAELLGGTAGGAAPALSSPAGSGEGASPVAELTDGRPAGDRAQVVKVDFRRRAVV